MANSTKRVQALIAKNIREIISFELNSEKIDFLTISEFDVSSDHSYAKVYVSFFTNPHQNLENLNKLKGFVRSALAKRVKLRRVPEIEFVLDDGFLREERMEKLLNKEKTELEEMKK